VVTPQPNGRGAWHDQLLDDLGVDPAELHARFFRPSWSRVVRGTLDLREALGPVLSELNAEVSVDELLAYWFERHSRVDDAVLRIALEWSEATGGDLALASNQERYRAGYLWNELGLSRHFSRFIVSADLGVTKDDVKFFTAARELLGCAGADRIVFVDDEESNVAVARSAHWDAHVYDGPDSLESLLRADLRPAIT
jgi:putative hydrolase of the HAD superfamily